MHKRMMKAATLAPLTLALSACVTARIEEFMTTEPTMAAGDTVVILTNRQDAIVETEDSFSECLYQELKSGRGQVNVISEEAFKDAIFPWFEPRLAPTRAESLTQLFENDRVLERIDELKLRYMVWIHGESEIRNKQGMMTCTLSPAGGGCLGVLSWDNASSYEASIWDIAEGKSLGIISSEATGTSVVPAIGVPIPMIARTKNASCKSLGKQLRTVLAPG